MAAEDERTIMERDTVDMMTRDFAPYTQRLSSGTSGSTKLGINSNIYSLYQNKQVGGSRMGHSASRCLAAYPLAAVWLMSQA